MLDVPQQIGFPPVDLADNDGLLLIGGDLSTEWLVEAYRRGIFPWPIVEQDVEVLSWWSPDPRAILELDELYVSRRLRRRIRQGRFRVTIDQDFDGVIHGCAQPRSDDDGTWITSPLVNAFTNLHHLGIAHSVEVWHEGELAGGIYGVALGGLFAGESMFHRMRDASKIAMVHLVDHLQRKGFQLLDVQLWSDHLGRLGAVEVSRNTYLRRLKCAIDLPVSF